MITIITGDTYQFKKLKYDEKHSDKYVINI